MKLKFRKRSGHGTTYCVISYKNIICYLCFLAVAVSYIFKIFPVTAFVLCCIHLYLILPFNL